MPANAKGHTSVIFGRRAAVSCQFVVNFKCNGQRPLLADCSRCVSLAAKPLPVVLVGPMATRQNRRMDHVAAIPARFRQAAPPAHGDYRIQVFAEHAAARSGRSRGWGFWEREPGTDDDLPTPTVAHLHCPVSFS